VVVDPEPLDMCLELLQLSQKRQIFLGILFSKQKAAINLESLKCTKKIKKKSYLLGMLADQKSQAKVVHAERYVEQLVDVA
jgi:hypothetical protein